MRSILACRTSRVAVILALHAVACVPCAAGVLEDALRLVPPNAVGAVVVPNVKAAGDDLQLAIDRMGRAEAAIGGRPLDLLKAQAGLGAGFDDRGSMAAWTVERGTGFVASVAIPVTDADAFIAATFADAPELGAGAMRARSSDRAVWVRKAGSFVIAADSAEVLADWVPQEGFAAKLSDRLGRRGMEIVRTADAFAWASRPVMRSIAASARAAAGLDRAVAGSLAGAGGAEAELAGRAADVAKGRERGAQVIEQVEDGLVAIDFDALAVGLRAYARFAEGSELRAAIPPSAAATREVAALLGRLPDASFYGAAGIDLRAMGGLAHVRAFLSSMPGSERLRLPEWLDAVQDKVNQVQVAAYPSRLGIAVGGILNDASFVVSTDDPAAVKAALRAWVESQAGERDGLRSEPTWEDARQLKDGSAVSAFAVKETVTGPGPDVTERLVKQFVVSSRGLHGFAREVPGGLVVTYSQRTDVLDRATAAASGSGKRTLGGNAMVRAMSPWLVPDADAVLFVGVGQLLEAGRQIAGSLPGGSEEMVPQAPPGLEPVAAAIRSKDGTWESALVIPSGVLGVAFDVARKRSTQ